MLCPPSITIGRRDWLGLQFLECTFLWQTFNRWLWFFASCSFAFIMSRLEVCFCCCSSSAANAKMVEIDAEQKQIHCYAVQRWHKKGCASGKIKHNNPISVFFRQAQSQPSRLSQGKFQNEENGMKKYHTAKNTHTHFMSGWLISTPVPLKTLLSLRSISNKSLEFFSQKKKYLERHLLTLLALGVGRWYRTFLR